MNPAVTHLRPHKNDARANVIRAVLSATRATQTTAERIGGDRGVHDGIAPTRCHNSYSLDGDDATQ